MKIVISNKIKTALPKFDIIAYTFSVVNKTTEKVEQLLMKTCHDYQNVCSLEEVVNYPKIKVARDAYKRLGKDPSRYRLACESLLRRVIKQLGLYRINDLVDLGNILSLMTSRSVCVVDLEKINGNIIIRQGYVNESYEAIGRGALNVSNMPLYVDDLGPFGSPTSDTLRTAITGTTNKILVMLICFDETNKEHDEKLLSDLYAKFAEAKNINKIEIIAESDVNEGQL